MDVGLQLMILGMGLVFAFLGLLVIMLRVLQYFAAPQGASPSTHQPEHQPGATPAPLADIEHNDPELMAVLSSAIHRYRHNKS